MKQITGWWFAPPDKKLTNGDGRKVAIGITHKVDPVGLLSMRTVSRGKIVPCLHGLHLSKRPIDALKYAPGPIIYKVRGSGEIVPHGNPTDKFACSQRTYIAGGVDCNDLLRAFARKCALDVVDLWEAPEIVVQYLKTGNEEIRAAVMKTAWATAMDAVWATSMEAARATAWAASMDTAEGDAMDAAAAAARADARANARNAAMEAAAMDAKIKLYNKWLKQMIEEVI